MSESHKRTYMNKAHFRTDNSSNIGAGLKFNARFTNSCSEYYMTEIKSGRRAMDSPYAHLSSESIVL